MTQLFVSQIQRRREIQQELFGQQTLPDICLDLRQALNGASDPWPHWRITKTIELLRMVNEFWSPSHPKDGMMDDAVLALVRATLFYIKDYHPEYLPEGGNE